MFKGIITPIVTPFKRDDKQSINFEVTKQLINQLIEKGVQGIFPLGSNGEFHVLSYHEKVEFLKFVIDTVDHRVPVFVGTGSCNINEAISLSQMAEKYGADALSVVAPYFIKPTDEEIVDYFKSIAASVSIPVILYNIPKNTGYPLTAAVLEACFKVENIIGVKDSSGDEENLKTFLEIAKRFDKDVWVGSDSKIAFGYRLGAIGAIAGTSNLITDVVVGLFQALEKGEVEQAEKYQQAIDVLRNELKKATVPAILKRSLELTGVQVGPARKPVKDVLTLHDKALKTMLQYYDLGKE